MTYNTLKKCSIQAGFTLVELAIVIAISGFSMLAASEFVKLYNINSQHQKTIEHINIAQSAMNEFVGLYGRYPCPADPTLDSSSAQYGLEQCRTTALLISNPDDCTGTNVNLSCTTAFSRDGDQNGSPDVVMIGIIPFRTLVDNIVDIPFRETHRLDGHSIYLSYAVTEHMTDRTKHNLFNPANPNTGGIRVEDEHQISLLSPDDSAHYVLFSHGENRKGGYTVSGTMVDNCMVSIMAAPPALPPAGPSGGGIDVEIENCENNDAIFVKGIRSLGDNSDYYDDTLVFKANGLWALWKRSLASPVGEAYIYNTNRGNVGVGTTNPTHDLHVVGDLSAENSTIANSYCDGIGTDCLLPTAIAGSGSRCLDGAGNPDYTKAAYAIQDNQIVCRDVNWVVPAITCPAIDVAGVATATFIRGFSNLGNALCCTQYTNDCCRHNGATCTPVP